MDAYTLPCESHIFTEGKVIEPSTTGLQGTVNFTNNGFAFLFSEMRYEANGVEIQKLKTPGIASCLKGYRSHTRDDLYGLQNAAWDIDMDVDDNKEFMPDIKFSGCLPLKYLFGFCEDYKKILLNCNQQLNLNRATTDFDALRVVGGGDDTHTNFENFSIELSKVHWRMSIVKVNDREKFKLLNVLDSRKPLTCAFRTWDLCEYPVLPENTSHYWTVKSSSLLDKSSLPDVPQPVQKQQSILRIPQNLIAVDTANHDRTGKVQP
ncbi:Hypothetical protein CINCED_3A006593 [Cinara cedri]|uniref:Double jelly roll-like domain-containing protein n=1 Tax=Cinara cedri TaxID=506608 RepID=A0A5E4N5T3_9HEMI|nr:Hypothetical protein CINCED_3A006593 [Cinara cedri]